MDDTYNFLRDTKAGICGCCGAGPHNNNQHSPNCSINLDGSVEKLMPAWQEGWNAKLSGKQSAPPDVAEHYKAHTAYMMGFHCAEARLLVESATKSPEHVG